MNTTPSQVGTNKNMTMIYRPFGALRFLLALMVVAGHSVELGGEATASLLRPWGLGNIAVMVFFVLSGFIIAEAVEAVYKDRIRDFLVNRGLRIIPPYFAALLASIVVHLWLASNGPVRFFDYEFMPEGIFSARNYLENSLYVVVLYGLGYLGLALDYTFVRYVWAVRVELHFYLAYAFVCWSMTSKRLSLAVRRYALPLVCALTSILFILAIATKASMLNYFSFAPYFMLGVSLQRWFKSRGRFAAGAVLLFLAMVVIHYAGYVNVSAGNLFLGPVLILLGLVASILMLAHLGCSRRLKALDQWLGDLSYPVYLNHYAVTVAFLTLCSEPGAIAFWVCVAVSIVFSWFIALLTEPVTKRLRERVRGFSLR
jgi:peptidoglycan/LPS O-acetylase OafA/YrhL